MWVPRAAIEGDAIASTSRPPPPHDNRNTAAEPATVEIDPYDTMTDIPSAQEHVSSNSNDQQTEYIR